MIQWVPNPGPRTAPAGPAELTPEEWERERARLIAVRSLFVWCEPHDFDNGGNLLAFIAAAAENLGYHPRFDSATITKAEEAAEVILAALDLPMVTPPA